MTASPSNALPAPAQSTLGRVWIARALVAGATLGALWLAQLLLPRFLNDYAIDLIMGAGISIILAVSLNLINGITGQFSLGHAGFMAIGAYSAAAFTRYAGPRLDLPPQAIYLLSLMLAATLSALAGFLVGLPSLRLRGDYLAIVTLGFGQIILAIIITIEELGGSLGMDDRPTLASGAPDEKFGALIQTDMIWLFALAIGCVLSIRNVASSHLGRAMRAVRDDEIAAEAAGINTTRTKVLSFVLSALWAGVAGGLYVHYNHSATPDDYNFVRSVQVVVMVVLGGLGSITGATFAAILLQIMDAALRSVNGVFAVGVALLILAAALSFPAHRSTLHTPRGLIAWLRGPGSLALALLGLWLFGRSWIESNDTPGKAEDWLRYVIYALILIVLMLLRPQGLFGREELSLSLFRRRDRTPPNDSTGKTSGEPLEAGVAGTLA